MSGWPKSVVNEFARRFAASEERRWPAYGAIVRSATIDSWVMRIVFGAQVDADSSVRIEDIRALRDALIERLHVKYGM
jgi:hypothetical protein